MKPFIEPLSSYKKILKGGKTPLFYSEAQMSKNVHSYWYLDDHKELWNYDSV